MSATPDPDAPGPGERPSHPAVVAAGCIAILVILVAVVVATASLARSSSDQANTNATVPAGPFYVPASTPPAGAPGTVLASEPIASPPPGTRGWRILYVSRAFDTDRPIAVSGVVFAPTTPTPDRPRPVVAWDHGTTGIASACAPSLATNGGANTIPGLDAFISLGYVVVATDYPGLGTAGPHPYLVGVSEARATLDGVRAAHDLADTDAGTSFVAWGHSQGGQAALFTAQLAPSYAPELHMVGAATAAPATDLPRLLQLDAGTLAGNGLTSLGLVAWSQVYPNAPLDSIVAPVAIPLARGVADHCISDIVADAPLVAAEKLTFTTASPASVEPWATIGRENSVGPTPIKVPMLLVQGTADDIVRPQVTYDFVAARCRAGESLQLLSVDGAGHVGVEFQAAPAVVLWTRDRFDGAFLANGCDAIAK